MLKTYNIKSGTIGFDDEEKIEFPTDEEATEYLREKEEKENEDQN